MNPIMPEMEINTKQYKRVLPVITINGWCDKPQTWRGCRAVA